MILTLCLLALPLLVVAQIDATFSYYPGDYKENYPFPTKGPFHFVVGVTSDSGELPAGHWNLTLYSGDMETERRIFPEIIPKFTECAVYDVASSTKIKDCSAVALDIYTYVIQIRSMTAVAQQKNIRVVVKTDATLTMEADTYAAVQVKLDIDLNNGSPGPTIEPAYQSNTPYVPTPVKATSKFIYLNDQGEAVQNMKPFTKTKGFQLELYPESTLPLLYFATNNDGMKTRTKFVVYYVAELPTDLTKPTDITCLPDDEYGLAEINVKHVKNDGVAHRIELEVLFTGEKTKVVLRCEIAESKNYGRVLLSKENEVVASQQDSYFWSYAVISSNYINVNNKGKEDYDIPTHKQLLQLPTSSVKAHNNLNQQGLVVDITCLNTTCYGGDMYWMRGEPEQVFEIKVKIPLTSLPKKIFSETVRYTVSFNLPNANDQILSAEIDQTTTDLNIFTYKNLNPDPTYFEFELVNDISNDNMQYLGLIIVARDYIETPVYTVTGSGSFGSPSYRGSFLLEQWQPANITGFSFPASDATVTSTATTMPAVISLLAVMMLAFF